MHIKRKFTTISLVLTLVIQMLAFMSINVSALPPYTVIVDVTSGSYVEYGSFGQSPSLLGYENGVTRYGHKAGSYAQYIPPIEVSGVYKVSYWNVLYNSSAKQAVLEVYNDGKLEGALTYDQTASVNGFVEVGEFTLKKGGNSYLKASFDLDKGGMLRTSAVKFELVREIADTDILTADVPLEESPYYDKGAIEVTLPVRDVTINEPRNNCMKLYVATNGSDLAEGTIDAPLATLFGARDRIRQIKANGMPAGGITVYVRGGIYLFKETFKLTSEDSGTADAPISYRAYPGEAVTLCGGYAMDSADFEPVTDTDILRRIPDEAHESLRVFDMNKLGDVELVEADYSTTTKVPAQLLVNGENMSVARWPNSGWAQSGEIIDSGSRTDEGPRKRGNTFEYDDPRPERWTEAENAWLYGFWLLDYGASYTRIVDIDRDRQWISGKHPVTWGIQGYKRFYAINLMEEIDMPGEWFLSTETRKLYLWPKEGFEGSTAILAQLNGNVINVSDSENILIRDFTIEGCNGTVVALGGKNNVVAGCTIRNATDNGVTISGANNGVRDSEIYNAGRHCVIMGGGDKKTITHANNYLENCIVHHSGQLIETASGIYVYKSIGNRIANNYVHHIPAQGMSFGECIDTVVEYNQLDIISTKMGDSGGIYTTLEQSNYDNIFRYNLVRDVMGLPGGGGHTVVGLYFDAGSSGVKVYGNTVVGADLGLLVNGGRQVSAYNNVLIDCKKGSYSVWDLTAEYGSWFQPGGSGYNNLVNSPYRSELWRDRWPELYIALDDSFGRPKYTKVMNNISYNCGPENNNDGAKQYATILYNKNYEQNPGFDETGYRLREDALVYSEYPDFERIDYDRIGLYRGGLRTQETAMVYRMYLDDFDITSPADNAQDIDPQKLTLQWDLVDGSLTYKVYLARDPEFKDIISIMNSQSSSIDVSGLLPYGTTIYWRVSVDGMRDVRGRWNSNGISSFTTIDIVEKKELLEAEALVALEGAVEGSSVGQYPLGSIAELRTAVSEADAVFTDESSTDFQKKYALKCLRDAIDKFTGSVVLSDEQVIICYDDFEGDVVGLTTPPAGFFLRTVSPKQITAETDPTDAQNKITLFNDNSGDYTQYISRVFPYKTKLSFNFRVYGEDEGSEFTAKLARRGQEAYTSTSTLGRDKYIAKVTFGRDGKIYVADRSIGAYEYKKWYNVRMTVDTNSNTYDVYMDGVLVAEKIPTGDPNLEAHLMLFATGDSAYGAEAVPQGKWYLDDILITAPVDTGKNVFANGVKVNGKDLFSFMPDRSFYSVGEEISTIDLDVADNSRVSIKDSKTVPGAKIAVVRSGNGRNISSYMFRP